MKKIMMMVLLSCMFIGCGNQEIKEEYIAREQGKMYKPNQEAVKEENKEESKETTLDDYINLRIWMGIGDKTNVIDEQEASVLNGLCKQNEEFMIFEKALENSIYIQYPELNN